MRRVSNFVGLTFVVGLLVLLYIAGGFQPEWIFGIGLVLVCFALTYLIPERKE